MNIYNFIVLLLAIFISISLICSLKKESFNNHTTNNQLLEWELVYEHQSPWQKIEFLKRDEDNTFALVLNNDIQVHSNEYQLSHYLQCSIPIEKYKPKNILILGGGDLIAASVCLKYNFVESVTLVEIDSEVVKFAKENETFQKITNNVSQNKKLKIHIGDAIEFIQNTPDKFDFIIEDVEIDFTKQKSHINRANFLKNCLLKSQIYCGSIPDHSIHKQSPILKQAKNKTPEYITYNLETLSQLQFSKSDIKSLKPIIQNHTINICAYDYGNIYGIEAYLLITKN